MALNAQSLRRRLEVRFEKMYAPAIYKQAGEAMVRHTQRAAWQNRGAGYPSVWGQIAQSVRYRMTFAGTRRRIVLSIGHPAAALKEFGGTIHAQGPWAENSPYPGVGIAKFIPLSLRGTPAEGKQLGKWQSMKFGAEGGTSYSQHRLHSMPLSRYLTSSVSERFGRYATMVGQQIKKNAKPAKRAAMFKRFVATSKLVFTKLSRTEIQPLYLLVKSCYIPPHKWIPSPEQLHSAVMRSFRRA